MEISTAVLSVMNPIDEGHCQMLFSILKSSASAFGPDPSLRMVSKIWKNSCDQLLIEMHTAQNTHSLYGRNWRRFCELHPELPLIVKFPTFVRRMILERPGSDDHNPQSFFQGTGTSSPACTPWRIDNRGATAGSTATQAVVGG